MSAVRRSERRVPVRTARLRTLFVAVLVLAAAAEALDAAAGVWRWLAVAAICLTGLALTDRPRRPARVVGRHPAARAARRLPDPGSVLDALDLPVAVVGPDGVMASANAAWSALVRARDIDLPRDGRNLPVEDVFAQVLDAPVWRDRAVGGTLAVATGFESVFLLDARLRGSRDAEWHRLRATALRGGGAVVWFDDVTAERLHEQLAHQVLHDPLTGLPNRVLFRDRLAHAIRHAERTRRTVAVIYVDLDGFKKVNDRFGHAAGDRLLTEIAQRFTRVLRQGDTLARLSGDEFAVVCDPVDDARAALAIAERLIEVAGFPVAITDADLGGPGAAEVGASAGVVVRAPGDGCRDEPEDLDRLLRRADRAMYRAKRAGRGCARLAPPEPCEPADPPASVIDLRERDRARRSS